MLIILTSDMTIHTLLSCFATHTKLKLVHRSFKFCHQMKECLT